MRAAAVIALVLVGCTSTASHDVVQGNYAAVTDASFSIPIHDSASVATDDLAAAIEGALTQKLEAVSFMDSIPDKEADYDAVIVLHFNDTQMHNPVNEPATRADQPGVPDRARLVPVVEYGIRRDKRVVLYGSVALRPLRNMTRNSIARMLTETAIEVADAIGRDLQKTGAQVIEP